MVQQQLNFSSRVVRRRHAGQCARRMIAYLSCTGIWQTRADMKHALGMSDRECRLGVEAAHGRIIFGQSGYRLTRKASIEEIDACAATIVSQIKALQQKYKQLILRRHRNVKD